MTGTDVQGRVLTRLRETFRPEFLNRIDEYRLSSMLLDGWLKPEQHVRVGMADGQPSFALDGGQPN
jgi:hypothetical protein